MRPPRPPRDLRATFVRPPRDLVRSPCDLVRSCATLCDLCATSARLCATLCDLLHLMRGLPLQPISWACKISPLSCKHATLHARKANLLAASLQEQFAQQCPKSNMHQRLATKQSLARAMHTSKESVGKPCCHHGSNVGQPKQRRRCNANRHATPIPTIVSGCLQRWQGMKHTH